MCGELIENEGDQGMNKKSESVNQIGDVKVIFCDR